MKKTIQVPETLFREATMMMDEEKGFSMSISSDTPYMRYDWANDEHYWEQLDHSPGGMDESRLKAGLPILFNHKRDEHLARATSYECDGRKCTVGGLKWSSSAFAQEKKKDAESGSLPDTSIGYTLMDDGELVGKKAGLPIYKFKFAIHEASLVTIPADITVGVGRQRSDGEKPELKTISINTVDTVTEEKHKSAPSMKIHPAVRQHLKEEDTGGNATGGTSPTISVVNEADVRNDAVAKERKRVAAIRDLNSHFKVNGIAGRKVDATEIAEQFIRDGKSRDDFKEAVVMGNLPEIRDVRQEDLNLGLSKRDLSQYSILRAINGVMGSVSGRPFSGIEREASDETARRHGRQSGGLSFFIPPDVMSEQRPYMERVLQSGVFTGAGALVPIGIQGQSMIEIYRNKMVVVAMGARVLTGLQGTLAIPRQTTAATVSWLSETATITSSDQAVGQLTLTPHRLAAATAFTTQLLSQSSPDVESFVRNDLMSQLAIEKDRVCLLGSGVNGEPLGIYGQPLTGANALAATVDITATDTCSYSEAVQFETNVATQNADVGTLGYVTSIRIRGTARVIPKFASTATPLWENDMLGSYKAMATNQLTAVPSIIFGNWADLIIADWQANEVIVDPYSLSMQQQVRVVVHQLTDVGIRHGKSFCYGVV